MRDLIDATVYTVDEIADLIGRELANRQHTVAENLRCAVWFAPRAMTRQEWIAACAVHGIKAGTASNRRSEALRNLADLEAA